ncbi:putative RNA methylase family UPF0020-domain-containing protein, partial [Jimgerdemannia flammicorona]
YVSSVSDVTASKIPGGLEWPHSNLEFLDRSFAHMDFCFAVPKGLETIAHDDIRENVGGVGVILVVEGSGFVYLRCDKSQNHADIVSRINNANLLSVESCYTILGTCTMPKRLINEKNPEILYDWIEKQMQDKTLFAWDECLAAIKSLVPSLSDTKLASDNPTVVTKTDGLMKFRASFEKNDHKHTVASQDIAGAIGSVVLKRFPHWKVDLKHYDLEVFGTWLTQMPNFASTHQPSSPSFSEAPDVPFLLAITVPTSGSKSTNYRNRVAFGRTAMRPTIAHCLVRMANPRPGDIVLDPCGGVGTIPIEGAYAYPASLFIGGEVHGPAICESARANVQHAKVRNVELMHADARRIHLRDHCIDLVVSDLPWGRREGSFNQIMKLYPKLMKELYRIIRPHGRAFLVTQGHKVMNRVLEYPWCANMFEVEQKVEITIGYRVYLILHNFLIHVTWGRQLFKVASADKRKQTLSANNNVQRTQIPKLLLQGLAVNTVPKMPRIRALDIRVQKVTTVQSTPDPHAAALEATNKCDAGAAPGVPGQEGAGGEDPEGEGTRAEEAEERFVGHPARRRRRPRRRLHRPSPGARARARARAAAIASRSPSQHHRGRARGRALDPGTAATRNGGMGGADGLGADSERSGCQLSRSGELIGKGMYMAIKTAVGDIGQGHDLNLGYRYLSEFGIQQIGDRFEILVVNKIYHLGLQSKMVSMLYTVHSNHPPPLTPASRTLLQPTMQRPHKLSNIFARHPPRRRLILHILILILLPIFRSLCPDPLPQRRQHLGQPGVDLLDVLASSRVLLVQLLKPLAPVLQRAADGVQLFLEPLAFGQEVSACLLEAAELVEAGCVSSDVEANELSLVIWVEKYVRDQGIHNWRTCVELIKRVPEYLDGIEAF